MSVAAATVLQLWERALPLDDAGRAVVLAGCVAPPATAEEVLDWPLGRRDARLLRLRAELAGPVLDAVVTCPSCETQISFEVEAERLGEIGDPTELAPVEVEGWRVTCRTLTTADLVAAAAIADVDTAERELLDRAVLVVDPPAEVDPEPLPLAVRRAVTDALAAADPLAEVLVELDCPECQSHATATVDVAAFAWNAVDTRARRLLHDVDLLARTYGWTEAEVLALGDRRRARYVDLARGGGA